MSDWNEVRLGDICEFISRGITPNYSDDGILVLNQKCIRDNRVNSALGRFTSLDTRINPSKLLKNGDILINSTGTGTLGRVSIYKGASDCVTVDGHVTILRAKKDVSPVYLGYFLHSIEPLIENLGRGSTNQKELSTGDLKRIRIVLPDITTQTKVAEQLSVFDSMIDNNSRRIELLEQSAQELYKEWFVRFRFSGHENAKFENGLPVGWELKKIGDIAHVKSGYAFKSEWWIDEGVPVVKIKDIQDNTIDFGDLSYVSEDHAEIAKYFYIVEGDLLIAMTGATIGKMALVPYSEKQMVVNQRVGKFFLGESPAEKVAFLYMTLQQNWVQELIVMIAGSNAAQPNISPFDIEKIKVVYNEDMVDEYNRRSAPFIEEILQLRKQNQNLATQRDMLLPRLMSGKLEV